MNAKPQITTVNWCDKCGRDDRWALLAVSHFFNGYRCTGEIHHLTYALIEDVA